jgi:hypothetical protein
MSGSAAAFGLQCRTTVKLHIDHARRSHLGCLKSVSRPGAEVDAERDYLPPIALYSVRGATSAFLASLMRLEIAALVSVL